MRKGRQLIDIQLAVMIFIGKSKLHFEKSKYLIL